MGPATYTQRRGAIETYFDRTALDAWTQLTSDAPVSKIRATVRAGRDRMRATLLDWLPSDLSSTCLLDAGCGTGALSVAVAQHGASVTAVDVSASLIEIARDRAPVIAPPGQIIFKAGDMLDPAFGEFDHVVAMDSLIHYETRDIVAALGKLAPRTRRSILFTVAPRTPLLSAMHAIGKLFPRSDRSPAIVPVKVARLRRSLSEDPALKDWRIGRDAQVMTGFYKSHAVELVRAC